VRSEAGVSGSLAHEVDSLIDSSQWRDIDGLSSDGTTGTDSGGVLSGSSLDDSFEENLEWVLSGKEVDDLKTLSEDSDSGLLFTILSVHTNHELIGESLGNWALDLLESFFLIFTSSVWDVHLSFCRLNVKISDQRLLGALNSVVRPFSKKFWSNSKFNSIFNDQFRFYK